MKRTTLFSAAALLALAVLLMPFSTAAAPRPDEAKTPPQPHPRGALFLGEGGPMEFALPFTGGGYLGVEVVRLTPELRAHFGAPEDAGVLVSRVEPDSPAADAGVAVGDILTAVDDEAIDSPLALLKAIRPGEDGETVSVTVIRGGRSLQLPATLHKRERQAIDLGPFLHWQGAEGDPVIRIDPKIREKIQIDPEVWTQVGERLQAIDWEDWSKRLEGMDWEWSTRLQPELEKRLEELEERLRELETELEKPDGKR